MTNKLALVKKTHTQRN